MNSFTVTIDRTLPEIQDAYNLHFNLPKDNRTRKSELNKLISELAQIEIDKINVDRHDDASMDIHENN